MFSYYIAVLDALTMRNFPRSHPKSRIPKINLQCHFCDTNMWYVICGINLCFGLFILNFFSAEKYKKEQQSFLVLWSFFGGGVFFPFIFFQKGLLEIGNLVFIFLGCFLGGRGKCHQLGNPADTQRRKDGNIFIYLL